MSSLKILSWYQKAKRVVTAKRGFLLTPVSLFKGPRPTHLKVQCAVGHKWITSGYSLVSDKHWCRSCGLIKAHKKKRYTIKDMDSLAGKRKGRCLSKRYLGSHTHLKWQCKDGHTWMASPTNIQSGKWCPQCRYEDLSARFRTKDAIKRYSAIAEERGGMLLTKVPPKNQNAHLKWKCKQGHIFTAKIANIVNGRWCRVCSSGRGERIVRSVFEQLYSKPFPSTWPDWLLFRGTRRQLDGYNESLELAFEHQGIQHYQEGFFNSTRSKHLALKAGDKFKVLKCKRRGVLLITVPEVPTLTPLEKIKEVVASQLRKAKRPLPKGFWSKAIRYDLAWNSSGYERIKSAAIAKGGRLVSKTYLGINHKYLFECGKGHRWESIATNIVRNISWCPHCWSLRRKQVAKEAGEKRVADSSLKRWFSFAKRNGGKLLLKKWQRGSLPAPWQCRCGTLFKRAPNKMIRDSFWRCPKCSPNQYSSGQRAFKIRRFSGPQLSRWKHYAEKHGGKLLLKKWRTGSINAPWKCKDGHLFLAKPNYLIKNNAWCNVCRTLVPYYRWKAFARKKGGDCLAPQNSGMHDLVKWKCKRGHLFIRQPSYLLKFNRWCPACT
jgi:hypothetical protein